MERRLSRPATSTSSDGRNRPTRSDRGCTFRGCARSSSRTRPGACRATRTSRAPSTFSRAGTICTARSRATWPGSTTTGFRRCTDRCGGRRHRSRCGMPERSFTAARRHSRTASSRSGAPHGRCSGSTRRIATSISPRSPTSSSCADCDSPAARRDATRSSGRPGVSPSAVATAVSSSRRPRASRRCPRRRPLRFHHRQLRCRHIFRWLVT